MTTNSADSPVPTTAPISPPSTPTTSPVRVIRAWSVAPVAPTSRCNAMMRVCPAMRVAQVLAVTIAPTYSAMPRNSHPTTDRIALTGPRSASPAAPSASVTMPGAMTRC
ncbi:hypothetical protein QP157_21365 [Sphingomonas sp. LR61]